MNSETGLNCFVKEDYQAFFFRIHKTKLHDSAHAGRKKGAKRQASKSTGQSSLNNFCIIGRANWRVTNVL